MQLTARAQRLGEAITKRRLELVELPGGDQGRCAGVGTEVGAEPQGVGHDAGSDDVRRVDRAALGEAELAPGAEQRVPSLDLGTDVQRFLEARLGRQHVELEHGALPRRDGIFAHPPDRQADPDSLRRVGVEALADHLPGEGHHDPLPRRHSLARHRTPSRPKGSPTPHTGAQHPTAPDSWLSDLSQSRPVSPGVNRDRHALVGFTPSVPAWPPPREEAVPVGNESARLLQKLLNDDAC